MQRFLFLAAFFIASLSFATVNGQGFGVRGGWQSAATYNDGDKVQENINSIYVGIYRARPIGMKKLLNWVGGLEYSQQGHKDNDDNLRRLHYISLPLALRLRFGPVHFQGGVNTNLRIAEKVLAMGEDITDQTKTQFLDFAYQLGAGFHFGRIGVEARYHGGLLDVNDGNKNRYLQIGASFRLKN